jgi:AAA domain
MTAKDANDVHRELGIDGLRKHGDSLPDLDFRGALPKMKGNGADAATPSLLPVYKPFPIDETSIPPRAWAVPGFLMRRHVTVLVAPSGSGKSLLTLQLGLAAAKGKSWAGWFPRGKFRVFVVNSEDDINEMRRRLAAAARAMEYDQNELRDSFILADESYEVVLAKFDARSKSLIRTPLFEQLVATIIENKVDILFVDPFAETFEGDENSNSELKWACTLWREVARRTNTAVCLIHHTKKYASGMAGDVDAARGASALIGVARIVATLFPMTPAEAELMQISEDQRVHYLRYDDAKANLNLKSPFARWFRKETFTLDNATADLPADDVGALIPWSPPGLMDDISESHIVEFFALVDAGLQDENRAPTGEFYTFSRRKGETEKSRYIGDFAKEFFHITEQTRVAKIIELWKSNGRLVEAEYTSPKQRKVRKCVHSERWKPEETDGPLQTET